MSASDLAIVTIAAPNPCAGNTPPNAVITSPASGLVNQVLNFSGLSSSDSTGTIQSYAWNFGDGQTANGVNVSHSYASAGDKTVTLTLTDSCGANASTTRVIVISQPNSAPFQVSAGVDRTITLPTSSVTLTGSAQDDGFPNPPGSLSYSWIKLSSNPASASVNFSSPNSASTNASFSVAGSYTIRLTVSDSQLSTSDDLLVTVNPAPNACAGNAAPIANAGADQTGNVGATLNFNGSGSSDSNGTISSYSWNFGDGSALQPGVNVAHSFAAAGNYTVILTVIDNCGASSISSLWAAIGNPNGPLQADFQVLQLAHVDPVSGEETWEEVGSTPDNPVENGLRVRFDGTLSTGGVYYTWVINSQHPTSFTHNIFSPTTFGAFYVTPNEDLPDTAPDPIPQYQVYVTLRIYKSDWSQQDPSITKTIYLSGPMRHRDHLHPDNANDPQFLVTTTRLAGDKLWAASHGNSFNEGGQIGVIDVADPSNPGELRVFDYQTPPAQAMDIRKIAVSVPDAQGEPKVYAISYTGFMRIFRADMENHILTTLPSGSYSPQPAIGGVACSGTDYFYIATRDEAKLKTFLYDTQNPSYSTQIHTLSLPETVLNQKIHNVVQMNEDVLLLDNSKTSSSCLDPCVTVVDIRNPAQPSTVTVLRGLQGGSYGFATTGAVSGRRAAITTSYGWTVLIEVNPSDDGSLVVRELGKIPKYSSIIGLDKNHVYFGAESEPFTHWVSKYDIRMISSGNADACYLMDVRPPMSYGGANALTLVEASEDSPDLGSILYYGDGGLGGNGIKTMSTRRCEQNCQ